MKMLLKYVWPGILSLYGFTLLFLIGTDQLKLYIHPRLHWLSYLAVLVLFLLVYEELRAGTKNRDKGFKKGYILFILPLVLGGTHFETKATTRVAAINGSLVGNVEATADPIEHISLEEAKAKKKISHGLVKTIEEYQGLEAFYVQSDVLMEFIEGSYFDIAPFEGKRFTYVGMVYKEEAFKDTELVIGRMMMYCCAADMQFVGIFSESEIGGQFGPEDWVEVTGVMSQVNYKMPGEPISSDIPFMTIESIHKVDPPDDPYVYY
jgi:putative membrane protein